MKLPQKPWVLQSTKSTQQPHKAFFFSFRLGIRSNIPKQMASRTQPAFRMDFPISFLSRSSLVSCPAKTGKCQVTVWTLLVHLFFPQKLSLTLNLFFILKHFNTAVRYFSTKKAHSTLTWNENSVGSGKKQHSISGYCHSSSLDLTGYKPSSCLPKSRKAGNYHCIHHKPC